MIINAMQFEAFQNDVTAHIGSLKNLVMVYIASEAKSARQHAADGDHAEAAIIAARVLAHIRNYRELVQC